jgi:glycosyltransferase involved in cell wall biosynthesis
LSKPEVSVVMGIFNSANTLSATLDSVLSQEGIDLELIAIDDGSTDGSGRILLAYAACDPRLIVLHQENRGLTTALIRGCALAQGEFIARQDAGGDISLPGRFAHQLTFLRSHATTVMTACGTLVMDPEGEPLYEIRQNGHELHERLRATTLNGIAGPSHHGAVMFRKSAYDRAGGYRSAFRVAQDLDLWIRMAEIGACLATPDVLYVACISKGSITHLNREQQKRATQTILRCAEARRQGSDEAETLKDVKAIPRPARGWLSERMRDAGFYYFIGSVLRTRQPERAHTYFMQALACWPLYPRAWFGLLRLIKTTKLNFGRTRRRREA